MTQPPTYRMPSVDEVLAGVSQGGVPRPTVSMDDLMHRKAPRPSMAVRLRAWLAEVVR